MKLLANENLSLDAVEALRSAGYDVGWIRTDSPGVDDETVLAKAVAEKRILLTFDKDFGELAFQRGLPATCGVILFRITASSSQEAAKRIVTALTNRTDWQGHFSVVDDWRIRMRLLPSLLKENNT
jgi:predicted nuclease of predicted toxin-antitoxin system